MEFLIELSVYLGLFLGKWIFNVIHLERPNRHPREVLLGAGTRVRLRSMEALTRGATVEDSPHGKHVHWRRGGGEFFFYERELPSGRQTVIELELPQRLLPTFQIRPRVGLRDAIAGTVGLEEFDRRFEVRVPRGVEAAPALPREVWAVFLEAANVAKVEPVLEVQPQRVRFYLPAVLLWGLGRKRILDRASRLFDLLLAFYRADAVGASIQVVEPAERMPIEETCQICGETIVARRVVCAKCGAPHHADCWAWTRGCAIFACQSREMRVG